MSVVFFGRRSLLSSRVLTAIARTHRIVGVVESQFTGFRPERRWRRLLSPTVRRNDIETFARRNKIPYFLLTTAKMNALGDFLDHLKPDIGVVAKCLHLLPERIISRFPRGLLNVHPSLLPNYRGPRPEFWIYYHGETTAGVTVHYIDRDMDTGDIVRQVTLPIVPGQSARDFAARYTAIASQMLPPILADIEQGVVVRSPQPAAAEARIARQIKKGENPIDWANWPLDRIQHVLAGAEGSLDLLPPRRFPYTLCDWSTVGYRAEPAGPAAPEFRRRGLSFFIRTAHGRILLKPYFTIWQARCGLRNFLRAFYARPDISLNRSFKSPYSLSYTADTFLFGATLVVCLMDDAHASSTLLHTPLPTPARIATPYAGPSAALVSTIGCLYTSACRCRQKSLRAPPPLARTWLTGMFMPCMISSASRMP